MSEINKTCTCCKKIKIQHLDFYMGQGKYRGECKSCTIKKNASYQKKTRSWENREIDNEKMRVYMKKYRAEHKEKFAEYRKKFKEKNPGYHRDYWLAHKDVK